MDSTEVAEYFNRKQREVLEIKCLSPWEYRIITPKIPDIIETRAVGAWILRMRGWSISAVARMLKESWYIADKLIKEGELQIEKEIGVEIE